MKTNLMIYKVCYNTPLSKETQNDIEKNVMWSMVSYDYESKQYNLDYVLEWFKDFYDLDQIEGEIKEDYELLVHLLKQEVEYIEF
jgi:hypothetical protein